MFAAEIMRTRSVSFAKNALTHKTATLHLRMARINTIFLKRRSQPMKVIMHDPGNVTTYTLEKPNQYSVVIYADNQYASRRDCFKCRMKNVGFVS